MTVAAHAPRIYIAYAPRAGLRCALAYLASGRDVYGWFTGPDSRGFESAYFVLEDYYGKGPTRYIAVPEEDLHSEWLVDEARCHELAELQDALVHEWLFYRGEPGAATQLARYAEAELAAGELNVRFERLARFDTSQPSWIFASTGFEPGVLQALAERWPLDHAKGEPLEPRPG